MDVCKFFRFIYLVVALGLVARSRGNHTTSLHENTTDDNFNNPKQPVDLSTQLPFTNSPAVEKSPSSGKAPSRPAPESAVAPAARSPVQPKVETHPEKDRAGLFLIILGALVVVCVILLVLVVVLACKVCYLQGQLRSSRPPLTNGAGNWSRGQGGHEVAGTDNTETSMMLEAVKAVKDEETTDQPGRTQEAADQEGKEADPAKEPDGGVAAAAATVSEPSPAADPEADKSPAPQTTRTPTSEPTPDEA